MNILRRSFIAFILLQLATVSQSTAGEKISGRLQRVLDRLASSDQALVWVYLIDKGGNEALRFSVPPTVVSERSLRRRAKVRTAAALVDYSDLPVEQSYVNQVASRVIRVRQQSKWFNSVSVVATKAQIAGLELLPIVRQVELLARFPRSRTEREEPVEEQIAPVSHTAINSLNYGTSFIQVNQIGVPAVHDLGNHGEGVMVGVLDNGFRLLTHQAFDSLHIIATYDFVDHKVSVVPINPSTSFGAHGVTTLSTIGGYRAGQLIGPAFKADYVLARTENDSSETPFEEDNWAAAIEWADSIGVDVTSTSLGYNVYDAPYTSWTWQDMNGNTTVITRAADMAVGRGILVVNSAGNDGPNASHNTLGAPADGDSVFTIGAVDSFGVRSNFSSVGPTTSVPSCIKPDVMAMGSSVVVASATNPAGYARSNGTSFSCPLSAGVAALMVHAWPTATPVQIMDALRSTASRAGTPDNSYGWGILNAFAAMQPRVPTLASPLDNATNQPLNLTLIWSAALGAETYRVQLATDSLFTSILVNDSTLTVTSKAVGPLTNNTRYYWRVRSKNIAGVSPYSTRRILTTLPGAAPPAAPTLVSPSNGSTNQPLALTLVWHSSSGATNYHAQLATDSLFTSLVVNDSTLTDTTLQVGSLSSSTKYYWRVRAKNGFGSSSFTSQWIFFTLTPPASPFLIQPASGSTAQPLTLTLLWHSASGAVNYHAQLATDSLFTLLVVNDSTLVDTSRQVSSLLPSQKYYWRVRARNGVGSSSFTSPWNFFTLTPPASPVLMQPVNGSTSQPLTVTLLWHSVASTVSYHAQLATDSLYTSIVVNDSTLVDTSRQVSLAPSTKYYWRARAKNIAGSSSFTQTWSFTTLTPPPAAPTLMSPSNGSTNQPLTVTLLWHSTSGVVNYHAQLATDSLFTLLVVNDSTLVDTSRQVGSLLPSTKYYWRMRATNVGGASPFTQTWNFRTLTPPPVAPTLVSPANGSTDQATSLSFLWRASVSATSYRLQLATDSLFTSFILNDSTLTDTTRMATLPGNTTIFWRVQANNTGGGGPFSTVWSLTTTAHVSRHYGVAGGWNLISIPLSVNDYRTTTLFPKAVSSAFGFVQGTGYATRDTLTNGTGYWLKFAASDSVIITGIPLGTDTIAVSTGWNLIGPFSSPIPVALILQVPPGIVQSSFFEYNGGYVSTDTLQPGQGYWVKCGSSGYLVLTTESSLRAADPSVRK